MKNTIKLFFGILSYPFFGLHNTKKGVTSIIFHHIDEIYFPLFKNLIIHLENKYGFIKPIEFESYLLGKKKINSRKILLTFDDGFKSNYYIAKQILDPLDIKSIFFVNPTYAKLKTRFKQVQFMKNNLLFNNANPNNSENPDNSEILPLTFDDMRNLIKNGHYIGSHTLNHKRLSELKSKKDLKNEILVSKVVLEKELNTQINHFAYPFGDINSISSEAMKLANQHYKYVHSGVRGINYSSVNKYALRREPLSLNDNIMYNNFLVNNGLSLLYRKKRLLLDSLL